MCQTKRLGADLHFLDEPFLVLPRVGRCDLGNPRAGFSYLPPRLVQYPAAGVALTIAIGRLSSCNAAGKGKLGQGNLVLATIILGLVRMGWVWFSRVTKRRRAIRVRRKHNDTQAAEWEVPPQPDYRMLRTRTLGGMRMADG